MLPDKITQAQLEKAQKEADEARRELQARMVSIKRAQQKARQEYSELALFNVLPAWAARWVINKGRGWICRLYGVRIDHWHYGSRGEQLMVFKRGKIVMTKIFRWDDGEHMEGKR